PAAGPAPAPRRDHRPGAAAIARGATGRSGSDEPGGDTPDGRPGGHVAGDEAAWLNARAGADDDAAEHGRAGREGRALADHDRRGDEILQPDRPLAVGDPVVEVDEDDLVVERRPGADVDPLVRGDDAPLAEARAGPDARVP